MWLVLRNQSQVLCLQSSSRMYCFPTPLAKYKLRLQFHGSAQTSRHHQNRPSNDRPHESIFQLTSEHLTRRTI